jgi:hypothetical protein
MKRLAILLPVSLLLSCGIPPDEGRQLPVPFRSQQQANWCAPAVVLMWRLYDGFPEISQQSIYDWMGGPGCTTQPRVRDAINVFTSTHDVYWDQGSPQSSQHMIARQITSFDSGTPSAPVVNYNHVVLLIGGKWHLDGSDKVWDFVYFHDPDPYFGGPAIRESAYDWLNEFCSAGINFCDQFVSSLAVTYWQGNEVNYGAQVRVYGGGGAGGGGPFPNHQSRKGGKQ